MNILNENEAIVINSLENWEKVAEILDISKMNFGRISAPEMPFYESEFPLFVTNSKGLLKWDKLEYLSDEFKHFKQIQDTEFIAKHSPYFFDERGIKHLNEEWVRNNLHKWEKPKQDKNMKIVVKKENGLLEVGQYTIEEHSEKFKMHPAWSEKVYKLTDKDGTINLLFNYQHDYMLENGYIEEVKEVSYNYNDMPWQEFKLKYEPIGHITAPNTKKQHDQVIAFEKLTHVRAKILKDAGYSEGWEATIMNSWFVCKEEEKLDVIINTNGSICFGIELLFPTKELAELALKYNQELFKTYLGV